MVASIPLGAGLPLGVSFYQKAPQIRNVLVDLLGLVLPPLLYSRVERIGGIQITEGPGRVIIDGQVGFDPVLAKHLVERGHFLQELIRENTRVGVDVIDGGAVDPQRGVDPRIIPVARVFIVLGQGAPLPE